MPNARVRILLILRMNNNLFPQDTCCKPIYYSSVHGNGTQTDGKMRATHSTVKSETYVLEVTAASERCPKLLCTAVATYVVQ